MNKQLLGSNQFLFTNDHISFETIDVDFKRLVTTLEI